MITPNALVAWTVYSQTQHERRNTRVSDLLDDDVAAYRRARRPQRARWTRRSSQTGSSDS